MNWSTIQYWERVKLFELQC